MKDDLKKHLVVESADHLAKQMKELLKVRKDITDAKRKLTGIKSDMRPADTSVTRAKQYHDQAVKDSDLDSVWNANLEKRIGEISALADQLWSALDDADLIAEMQIRYANKRKTGKTGIRS